MARTIKIDNALQKRFSKQEKKKYAGYPALSIPIYGLW